MSRKTDNHNPAAKLCLRRYFLNAYHSENPPDVLDCYSGYGAMWGKLKNEFRVKRYTGIDVRKIPGALRMDSLQYLRRDDWEHDVVDLDAYGSPWKHFFTALPRLGTATTIFLTVGNAGLGSVDRLALEAAGITFDVPIGMHKGMCNWLTDICIASPLQLGFRIRDARESMNPGGNARYLGLRLERER